MGVRRARHADAARSRDRRRSPSAASCTGSSSSWPARRSTPSTCRSSRRKPTSTATTGGDSCGRSARRRDARRLPRGHHRRRPRRPLRGDPARAGRDPVHGVRQERRRRRHLVREHLPRPAGRRAQPLLLLLVPAQPRLVALLRAASTSCSTTSRRCAEGARRRCRTCGSAPRCGRPTFDEARAAVARRASATRDGESTSGRGQRAHQRGRACSTARRSPTSRASTRSRARGSTRRAGTTTSTSRGKRVAVIGTGASAMQFVPAIAPDAEHVTIFQRSRHWVTPNPDYHRRGDRRREVAVPHTCPTTLAWYRVLQFWNSADRMYPAFRVDPDWPDPDVSISRQNDKLRRVMTAHVERELAGAARAGRPRCCPTTRRWASACCRTTAGSAPCCATTSTS